MPVPSLQIALESGEALLEADVEWSPCYRLIASEYAGENIFDRLTSDADEVEDFRQVADLTSPLAQHDQGLIDLVPPEDRIYGLGSGLIMAAFAWPGQPSRFSDGTRGTYYAAHGELTAQREVSHHLARALTGADRVVVEMTLIEAGLQCTAVDLRAPHPTPPHVYDPVNYGPGQEFGRLVRDLGADGIVYDSVRHRLPDGAPAGHCVAIFRPNRLANALAVQQFEFHWDGRQIVMIR